MMDLDLASVPAPPQPPEAAKACTVLSGLPTQRGNLKGALRQVEQGLRSDKANEQLEATKKIRQLLSAERDFLIQDMLDRDVVPQLLRFLQREEHSALQVEALCRHMQLDVAGHSMSQFLPILSALRRLEVRLEGVEGALYPLNLTVYLLNLTVYPLKLTVYPLNLTVYPKADSLLSKSGRSS